METKKCYSTTEHGVSTLGGRYSTTEQSRGRAPGAVQPEGQPSPASHAYNI